MATNTAILAIRVYGDGTQAHNTLITVQHDIQQTENQTNTSSKKMAGAWAAVGAAVLGVVKASAAMESATNALNTVFGEQSAGMVEWAEGMAQYGLSTAQAGAAASVLGVSLKNAGLSTEQAAVATQALVETSAELAVVMGGSASEAAAAMGAALRGEYDSLERFGIALTADAVAAEALALQQQGLTFASEQQAKTVATLSLIQEQSTAILAGAEEGVVTMQGATDHLIASTKNLAGTIGGVLTPILGPLIESTADVIDKFTGAIAESELLADVSQALSNILAAVADILDTVVMSALTLMANAANAVWAILEPFLVPILERLAQVLDTVAQALTTVIGFVNSAITAFNNLAHSIANAIDKLTFWNDTVADTAPPPAQFSAPAPAGYGVAAYGAPMAYGSRGVTINIQTGIGDPHAIAREIRRVLAADKARVGWR